MSVLNDLSNPPVGGDQRYQDRQGDKAVALQAAIQCTGPVSKTNLSEVRAYHHEFERWLKDAGGDHDERMRRRRLLLTATHGQLYAVDGTPQPPVMVQILAELRSFA